MERHEWYDLTADEARDFIFKKKGFVKNLSIENFKLIKLISIYRQAVKRTQAELPFATKLAVDELEKLCRDRCNAVVVYIPNSELWRPDARADSYRRRLQKYTRSKNMTFIDTTEQLRSLTDSEAYAIKRAAPVTKRL